MLRRESRTGGNTGLRQATGRVQLVEITTLNFGLFLSFQVTLETYSEGWAVGPVGEGLDGCGYSWRFVGI